MFKTKKSDIYEISRRALAFFGIVVCFLYSYVFALAQTNTVIYSQIGVGGNANGGTVNSIKATIDCNLINDIVGGIGLDINSNDVPPVFVDFFINDIYQETVELPVFRDGTYTFFNANNVDCTNGFFTFEIRSNTSQRFAYFAQFTPGIYTDLQIKVTESDQFINYNRYPNIEFYQSNITPPLRIDFMGSTTPIDIFNNVAGGVRTTTGEFAPLLGLVGVPVAFLIASRVYRIVRVMV